jgi:hypothetical protein
MLLGCGCLLAMGAAFAPRVVLLIMWIVGPRVNAAFNNFVVPLLGLIFLPYTTIMYVLVWSPATGLSGWDWIWVALGVMLDIMKWGQIANKRREIPGYRSEYDPIPRTAYEADIPRTPHKAASDAAVSEPAVSDTEAEMEKLADLRDKGIITDEEFDQKKEQLTGE